MTEITQEVLQELLDYNPETGEFVWKERDAKWFPDEPHSRMWNKKFAGKRAFNTPNGNGYLSGRVFNKKLYAHRVAYLYERGSVTNDIDHIDGDRTNNAARNLRCVTRQGNLRNQKIKSNNTSGTVGVTRHTTNDKWVAQIMVDGVNKYLGSFTNIEDAIAARENANKEYNFHPNHGQR